MQPSCMLSSVVHDLIPAHAAEIYSSPNSSTTSTNTNISNEPPQRIAGCTLPVEMFFPEEEFPIKAVEKELQQLGVMCSVLPDLVPTYAIKNSSNLLTDTEGKRLAGFSMKSAAILLSSFEEVRLLMLVLLCCLCL